MPPSEICQQEIRALCKFVNTEINILKLSRRVEMLLLLCCRRGEVVPCMDHVSALTPPLGDKSYFGGGDAGMSHEEKQEVGDVGGQ